MSNKVEVTLPDGTKHIVDSGSIKPYKEPVEWEYVSIVTVQGDSSLSRRKKGTIPSYFPFNLFPHRIRSTPQLAIVAALVETTDLDSKLLQVYLQTCLDIMKEWEKEDAN